FVVNSEILVVGFPVLLPRLQFKFVFPLSGGPGTQLSSGSGVTAHADFVNGWEPAAMQLRVEECLRKDTKCNPNMPQDNTLTRILGPNNAPSDVAAGTTASDATTADPTTPVSQTHSDDSADPTEVPPP